jgi:hypothetical protein
MSQEGGHSGSPSEEEDEHSSFSINYALVLQFVIYF